MTSLLIFAGGSLLACLVAHRVFARFGVPSLLAFIALGMLFGQDGPLGVGFSNYELCEHVCTVGLVFIMFYGGFGTKWSVARPHAAQAVALASLGTVVTAGVCTLGGHVLLGMGWAQAFVLGSVISSTDAASVFAVLRAKKLNLRDGLASVLEVESGSNDPFAYLLTFVALLVLQGAATPAAVATTLVVQLALGAACGAAAGVLATFALDRMGERDEALSSALLVAVALVSFCLPDALGGNGFLSVYLTGIILGNSRRIHGKVAVVRFFDSLTHMAQIAIFFLFGLLSFPSQMLQVLPAGLVTFAVLTFVARPCGVALVARPAGRSWAQVAFMSAAGLRGAASLTFALVAFEATGASGALGGFATYHTVLWVVVLSILTQGMALPALARALCLVDDEQPVMRTFTDFVERSDYSLLELPVHTDGSWAGRPLRDVDLPCGFLAMLVRRGEESIIPHGSTVLEPGDRVVMSAPTYTPAPDAMRRGDVPLRELFLDEGHPWVGKTLAEVPLSPTGLAVMVRRAETSVVPRGSTVLMAGDVVVYSGTLPPGA